MTLTFINTYHFLGQMRGVGVHLRERGCQLISLSLLLWWDGPEQGREASTSVQSATFTFESLDRTQDFL